MVSSELEPYLNYCDHSKENGSLKHRGFKKGDWPLTGSWFQIHRLLSKLVGLSHDTSNDTYHKAGNLAGLRSGGSDETGFTSLTWGKIILGF